MSVKTAAQALLDGLGSIAGFRAYADLGAVLEPPAAVLGPPALTWSTPSDEPTGATFLIYVCVESGERSLEQLWDLVPVVAAALDDVRDVDVIRADPGSYTNAGVDLPAYVITVEMEL